MPQSYYSHYSPCSSLPDEQHGTEEGLGFHIRPEFKGNPLQSPPSSGDLYCASINFVSLNNVDDNTHFAKMF